MEGSTREVSKARGSLGRGGCVCVRERERGSEMNSGMQIGFRKVPYDTFFQNLLSDFLKWSLFSTLK